MSPARKPLQALSTNTLSNGTSTPSSSGSKPFKLAPIFTPSPQRSSSSADRVQHIREGADTSNSDSGSSRKRVKRDVFTTTTADEQTDDENDTRAERTKMGRKGSMMSYFGPATPARDTQPRSQKRVEQVCNDQVPEGSATGLWRRKRARFGLGSSRTDSMVQISCSHRAFGLLCPPLPPPFFGS